LICVPVKGKTLRFEVNNLANFLKIMLYLIYSGVWFEERVNEQLQQLWNPDQFYRRRVCLIVQLVEDDNVSWIQGVPGQHRTQCLCGAGVLET
jgi:hypothetical protein